MGKRRLLQALYAVVMPLITLATLFVAGPLQALVPLLMGCVAVTVLEVQIRHRTRKVTSVRGSIEALAGASFDAPAEVGGTERSAEIGGTFRGARVSIASHITASGRRAGTPYSEIVVDVLGLDRPFDVTMSSSLVDVDDAFARDVLDDETVRARLLWLRARAEAIHVGDLPDEMTVQLSSRGLALRWPGELDPVLACWIRDLLLDMRDRMLAHENRKATSAVQGTGYRVAEPLDEEPLSEPPEPAARAR